MLLLINLSPLKMAYFEISKSYNFEVVINVSQPFKSLKAVIETIGHIYVNYLTVLRLKV